MKAGIISGILLLVLVVYLLLPVLPIVDYLINKDYIAKNLCINRDKPKRCCKGKCHLLKQLKKCNSATENENKNRGKKAQYRELDEFVLKISGKVILRTVTFNHLIFNSSELLRYLVYSIFVPPEPTLYIIRN